MRITTSLVFSMLSALPALVSPALIPGADTAVFFLVGTDPHGDNFLPLRLTGQHAVATLGGTAPIAMLYFINGTLVAEDPVLGPSSPLLYHAYIDLTRPFPYISGGGETPSSLPDDYVPPVETGACGTSGPLRFVQDQDRGKIVQNVPCASFDGFSLFSDRKDAQLGAKLVYNTNLTQFWACGQERDIVWKTNDGDMPIECVKNVQLFTLPVV